MLPIISRPAILSGSDIFLEIQEEREMSDRNKVMELFEANREEMEDRINNGIERNRKGFCHIRIKDGQGNPLPGARISVRQKTHEFKYGANLFMLDELETQEKNEAYKKYFADLFNMATLPFYWDATEPEQGHTRYAKDSEKIYRRPPIDLCIEFCEAHGIEPREHALAYSSFFPRWVRGLDTQKVKQALEQRYREISERYAKKIPVMEVTNEMYWEKGTVSFYDDNDYVEFCFKLAEKYFPANKLCINEYSGLWEGNGRCTDAYYAYIENAMLKGARIDAVGMQYHMFHRRDMEYAATRKYYDPLQLYKIMDQYAKLGKPIEITEVTIPAYSQDSEDEEIQAKLIETLYRIWFSHESVEQVIYWNLVDGYAAFAKQGDMSNGENYYYGGLVRFDMTPKPAYYTIKNLFEKTWHTEAQMTSDESGKAQFKGFYGKYEAEIEWQGKKFVKEIDLKKGDRSCAEIALG